MSIEQRERLAAIVPFLPAGARVLNLGFSPDIFAQGLANDCHSVRISAGAGHPASADAAVDMLPEDCYAVMCAPLAADRGGARLLRSVAAANARLLCVCDGSPAITDAIGDAGCHVRASRSMGDGRHVLSICRRPAAGPKEFEVVTLSWAGLPNFGDRLGIHLINQVLPAHATVRHEFRVRPSMWEGQRPIDLLVLGLGFSMFQPLLYEPLQSLIDHSARVVGIFGTQYRQAIDRKKMSALMKRLDVWYARYEEDLLLFGGDCRAVHLGDWLIHAFPMAHPQARPALADTLVIGPEIMLEEVSLDRLIQRIQSYRRVVSSRLHPLLCALTSAEEVAYYEQREDGSGESSGKFRSMLLDVFGVHHPPDAFFSVDRAAVREYRRHVQAAMRLLAADLWDARASRASLTRTTHHDDAAAVGA
jgi:hypothetical protein